MTSRKERLRGGQGPVYKRKGHPSKRVKDSSGLQANFTGRVTLSPGSTDVFRHA